MWTKAWKREWSTVLCWRADSLAEDILPIGANEQVEERTLGLELEDQLFKYPITNEASGIQFENLLEPVEPNLCKKGATSKEFALSGSLAILMLKVNLKGDRRPYVDPLQYWQPETKAKMINHHSSIQIAHTHIWP
ncbi:hypothetical protein TREES_T100005465 [Tupaia chinensis]|uniref:Uncharacterized protein n=1 Tax=Tupaia chinensis TaxID=246437 RepID=L9KPW1_TUPCH|nr:hypothetical protein TREES_T100005465 [Tupaia chinensis]